jgi:hypothetical protein
VGDSDREIVLSHRKENQQGNQELENLLQEKSIPHKSERIIAETFDLISTLLTVNPYQIHHQMKQETDQDQEEEERKKKLKKKKAFSLSR